jgi:hypothetical protein
MRSSSREGVRGQSDDSAAASEDRAREAFVQAASDRQQRRAGRVDNQGSRRVARFRAPGTGNEPDEWRQQQRIPDLGRLRPVDAARTSAGRHQLIRAANANDRADQRVRAGGRQAEIPRAEIPDDRADEKRKHHRNPALDPTCRISSTGRSAMIPYTTAPLDP